MRRVTLTEWLGMTRGVITHKCGVWSGWIDPPAPNHSVQGLRKCPLILVIFCWRLMMLFTFHATRNFEFSARIDSVSTLRASLRSAKVFELKTSLKRTCRSRNDSGRYWKSTLYGANNWVNATSNWILKVERNCCFCWVTCFNSYRLSLKRISSIKVVKEPLGDEDLWYDTAIAQ